MRERLPEGCFPSCGGRACALWATGRKLKMWPSSSGDSSCSGAGILGGAAPPPCLPAGMPPATTAHQPSRTTTVRHGILEIFNTHNVCFHPHPVCSTHYKLSNARMWTSNQGDVTIHTNRAIDYFWRASERCDVGEAAIESHTSREHDSIILFSNNIHSGVIEVAYEQQTT